jgi:uncharacterized RDD family membrane protein YckC
MKFHSRKAFIYTTTGRQTIDKDKHQPLKNAHDSESSDSSALSDASTSAESQLETRAGKDVLLADPPSESDSRPTLVVDDDESGSVEATSDDEEKAFVIDFGIATVLESARSATTDVTRTGEIFGTPHYMSPEQCVGEKPDERSDIYSFGCLMYETLTGRPPFRGVNPVQIIMQHLKNAPPEFESDIRKKKLAEQLELVTMKCLEKERQKRLPSFSAVKAELDRLASGVGRSSIKVYSKAPIMRRGCASLLDGFIICLIYHFIASGSFYTEHMSMIVPTLSVTGIWTTLGVVVSSISATLLSVLPGSAWPAAWLVLYYLQASNRDPWLVVFPIIAILYYCIFECSSWRATPGKMYFGLVVKPADDGSVSLTTAFKRLLLKLIGFQTCFIGAIVAPADPIFFPALMKNLSNPPTDQWSGAEVVCETSMPGQVARPTSGSLCIRFGVVFLGVLAAFLLLTPPLSYMCAGLLVLKIMYEDCRVLLGEKTKVPKSDNAEDLGASRAENLTMAQVFKYGRLALIWMIVFVLVAWLFRLPLLFTGLLLLPLFIYIRSYNARFRELSGQAALSSAPSWTTLFMRSLGNGRKKG